jgi:hypothetical protein
LPRLLKLAVLTSHRPAATQRRDLAGFGQFDHVHRARSDSHFWLYRPYLGRVSLEAKMSSDDDQKKMFTGKWGKATIHEDGSITAENEAVTVELGDDGKMRTNLKKLTKVAIDNIIDLESHTIKQDQTATSHHVVYRGGGEARFSCRSDGKLLEFSASGLGVSIISKEGIVTLGLPKDPPA